MQNKNRAFEIDFKFAFHLLLMVRQAQSSWPFNLDIIKKNLHWIKSPTG